MPENKQTRRSVLRKGFLATGTVAGIGGVVSTASGATLNNKLYIEEEGGGNYWVLFDGPIGEHQWRDKENDDSIDNAYSGLTTVEGHIGTGWGASGYDELVFENDDVIVHQYDDADGGVDIWHNQTCIDFCE